jgi:hypothetical protein
VRADFGAALSLREADALRKAAFDFLTAAKAAFQVSHSLPSCYPFPSLFFSILFS